MLFIYLFIYLFLRINETREVKQKNKTKPNHLFEFSRRTGNHTQQQKVDPSPETRRPQCLNFFEFSLSFFE